MKAAIGGGHSSGSGHLFGPYCRSPGGAAVRDREVCVNASEQATARQLFPNARLHVIPDSNDPEQWGFRIVSGAIGAEGKIMTDAEEVRLRRLEAFRRIPGK